MTVAARFLLLAPLLLAMTCAAAIAKDKKPAKEVDAGTFDANGRYQLSASEQKFDCKKLNGRMQMRIMQLRAELADPVRPSGAAQGLQQVTNPALKLMFGGASGYGTDRDAQLGRDRAMLDAYNAQLAAKSCPTYDLAAELKKGPSDPAPAPVRAADKPKR